MLLSSPIGEALIEVAAARSRRYRSAAAAHGAASRLGREPVANLVASSGVDWTVDVERVLSAAGAARAADEDEAREAADMRYVDTGQRAPS